MNDDDLLTALEAGDFLRVEPKTLEAWRRLRQGPPFVRVGRSVRYRRGDLHAWIEANTVEPE